MGEERVEACVRRGHFAVQTAREHAVYEPLDTTQWEFYVLPRPVVAALDSGSVGLGTVCAAGGPTVSFSWVWTNDLVP
ncbi:hypothetical protein AB0929_31440 [Streptomyces massasporeus]|uniref:hypothetical protein n=1 Tax=Streptomyces massasporeus TaxID=67324 RepID=UPI0034520597